MAVLIACVGVAAASLALPFAPAYDPWAWLVWGRELTGLDLDTAAGPSWKPLPVAVDAVFAPLGDLAPQLWLVVARGGWLLALFLAWRLASRLAGTGGAGAIAGAVAAVGLFLLEDSFTPWLRQFAGGLSEPLLVALCLLAVDRALVARHGQAIAAGAAAAMIRPETWPFLAAYAIWACRRDGRLRAPAAVAAAIVAVAWFVPDLLGAGNPLEGAERARGLAGGSASDALEVIERAFELVPVALWPLAALAAVIPSGPHAQAIRALAAGAFGWIVLVAAMAAAGYAGLPRFMAPAAAAICVLAGVGAAEVWRRLTAPAPATRTLRMAAGAGFALLVLASFAPRVADLPDDYREARDLGERDDDLRAVAEDLDGPAAGCSPVATDAPLSVTAIAWWLDQPLAGVASSRTPPSRAGLAFAVAGGPWDSAGLRPAGGEIAAAGPWAVYRPCAP